MPSYRNTDKPLPIMQGSPPRLIPPRVDWDRAPWNRWSFQHVREIVPTAEVWRGRGPVRPLPRDDRDLDTLPLALSDGSPGTLARFLDETYTDGFIVLKAGRIVYERYFNNMDDRTLHLSQSVGKSITAATAGALIGRGLLTSAPITDYLPELTHTGWRGATLQQVLDMTTGVRFGEEYTDPYSDIGRLDVADGWKPIPAQYRSAIPLAASHVGIDRNAHRNRPAAWRALCLPLDRNRRAGLRHGARHRQAATATHFRRNLAETRCRGERRISPSGTGRIRPGDGGFNATLRDYARFGQLYLDHGMVDGVEIIPLRGSKRRAMAIICSFVSLIHVAAGRRLSQSVLDRGPAIAFGHGARRLWSAHLCELGPSICRGETVELARLS